MNKIDKLAKTLKAAQEDKKTTSPYDTTAKVVRVEGGTAYVNIPGGVEETPASMVVNAKKGDTVMVNVSGGKAYVTGNETAPPTDDSLAEKAEANAIRAQNAADKASVQAGIAEKSANKAVTDASTAHKAATQAVEDASIAKRSADSAQASANRAQASADAAQESADAAQESADEAIESAETANTAASNALRELSTVEDVVDVLTWITEHGIMTSQAGGTFVDGQVYFIVDQNGDYEVGGTRYSVVQNPVASDINNYYVLSVDEAVTNYVATHIAVDAEGLWIIPDTNNANRVLIATGAGSQYTTAGTYIVGNGGAILAKFTATKAILGEDNKTHAEIGSNYLKLIDKQSNTYLYVSDLRDSSNNAEIIEHFIKTIIDDYCDLSITATSILYVKIDGTTISQNSYSLNTQYNRVEFSDTSIEGYHDDVEIKYNSSDDRLKAFTFGSRLQGGFVGALSCAIGMNNTASGTFSFAEGALSEAIGYVSHAEGTSCTASGMYSHAEGLSTEAVGQASHAEGDGSIADVECSHAEGQSHAVGICSHSEGTGYTNKRYSHAEGRDTYTNGVAAHAEGYSSQATGDYSHAEGEHTTASGNHSHTESYYASASADCAHAEGEHTTASGDSSHAEGEYTTASGNSSHAEGEDTTASKLCAHAEGYNTTASGNYSHAEGNNTNATAQFTHAGGFQTNAGYDYQTAIGKYNDNKSANLFEIGNGTSNNARQNVMEVNTSGTLRLRAPVNAAVSTAPSIDFYAQSNGQSSEYGGYLRMYSQGETTPYGMNGVLETGGGLFIGSGESPANHYSAKGSYTGEETYITSDTNIKLQCNGNTITNRRGVAIWQTSNNTIISPCKEDAVLSGNVYDSTTGYYYLGADNYRWTGVYANNVSTPKLNSLSVGGASGDRWGTVVTVNTSGVSEIGKYLDFHETDTGTEDYTARLYCNSSGSLICSGLFHVNGALTGALQTPTGSFTATTGIVHSYTVRRFGQVVYIYLAVKNASAIGVGNNLFVGKWSGVKPVVNVTGSCYSSANGFIGVISSVGDVVVRVIGSGTLPANSAVGMSFTFITSE